MAVTQFLYRAAGGLAAISLAGVAVLILGQIGAQIKSSDDFAGWLMAAVGIDPIWFGICLVIVVETARITKPPGFNLFAIRELTGRNIFSVVSMTRPFFLILCLLAILITVCPAIVRVLLS